MYIDLIVWDDEDDPKGNVQHIVGPGEVTTEDVDEVLRAHQGPIVLSDSSGNPMVFGWTSTGNRIVVIFEFEDHPDLVIVIPITAYPVPEYGD